MGGGCEPHGAFLTWCHVVADRVIMGLLISKVWDSFFSMGEVRMLMIGLDAAGKTTILYKLKLGEVVKTVPTIGMLMCAVPIAHGRVTCSVFARQASMWRPFSTRTFRSMSGILEAKTRCAPGCWGCACGVARHVVVRPCRSELCGGTTTKAHKASFLWWTATTVIV